jgi:hypothetical protein
MQKKNLGAVFAIAKALVFLANIFFGRQILSFKK